MIDENFERIPESLEKAIRQFIISGAIRMKNNEKRTLHHSMMIHIHHETRFQNPLFHFIKNKLLIRWKDILLSSDHHLHNSTKTEFKNEFNHFEMISKTGKKGKKIF